MHDCHCNDLVTNNNQVLLKAGPLKQGNLPSNPKEGSKGHLFQSLWSAGIVKPAVESSMASSPTEK